MKIHLIKTFLIGSLLTLLVADSIAWASEKKSKSLSVVERAQGGIDSSGGNLTRTDWEEFNQAFEASKKNVALAYHRLSSIYFSREYLYDDDEQTEPTNNLQGLVIIRRKYSNAHADFENYFHPQLADILHPKNKDFVQNKIKSLTYKPQTTDCTSKEGHRDASVTQNGQVCLNVQSVMRIPPELIELHLTALLAHEVAHVLKLPEEVASKIQQSLLQLESVALSHTDYVKSLEEAFENHIARLGEDAREIHVWLRKSQSKKDLDSICESASERRTFKEGSLLSHLSTQESEYYIESRHQRLLFSDLFFNVYNSLLSYSSPENAATTQLGYYCSETSRSGRRDLVKMRKLLEETQIELLKQQEKALNYYRQLVNQLEPHPRTIDLGPGIFDRMVSLTDWDHPNKATSEAKYQDLHKNLVCTVSDSKESKTFTFENAQYASDTDQGSYREQTFPLSETENSFSVFRLAVSQSKISNRYSPYVKVTFQISTSVRKNPRTDHFVYETWKSKRNVNVSVNRSSGYSILSPGLINGFQLQLSRNIFDSDLPTVDLKNVSISCRFKDQVMPQQTDRPDIFLN